MLSIRGIDRWFGGKGNGKQHVLRNLDIDFPDRGLVVILGPSGCGKTTLLNLIGGLDRPDRGNIVIDNRDFTRISSSARDNLRNRYIGYIFQDYNLIDNNTVYENVAMSLKMQGMEDSDELKKKVRYILEKTGMYRFRKRMAGDLSGGQRQRVAIARAVIKNPPVIIADEPTGNLDSRNTVEIMNMIRAVASEKLVIMVTHEEELAEYYADRIIRMKDGAIISDEINSRKNTLDYSMDNRIYLGDMKRSSRTTEDGDRIDICRKDGEKLDIQIIMRDGNIFIRTGDAGKRIHVVDSSSPVEIVEGTRRDTENEEYSFDTGKLGTEGEIRYRSMITAGEGMKRGFRRIRNYSFIKKMLLAGFLVSAMFITYGVSSIAGIGNVEDRYFASADPDTLSVSAEKNAESVTEKLSGKDGIDYMMNGDGSVMLNIDGRNLYQTEGTVLSMPGTLTAEDRIDKNDLVAGDMPENSRQVVIDMKSVRLSEMSDQIRGQGYVEPDDFVGVRMYMSDGTEVTVSGVTDRGIQCVYADRSLIEEYSRKNSAAAETVTVMPDEGMKEQLMEELSSDEMNVRDVYNESREMYRAQKLRNSSAMLVMAFMAVLISVIEIYLMIRASFLSRVREMGIYRAVGVKKRDIYKTFAGEIIAMTTAGSMPGFIFMSYAMWRITSVELLQENFAYSVPLALAALVLIYGINIAAGLVPVIRTVRKQPAQILARTDT